MFTHFTILAGIMKEKVNTLKLVQISIWLNGKQLSISVPPGMTTLELLNDKLNLSGTKSSCNEGDCGACTVVLAQNTDGKIVYKTVNSCLYPAFRLHGKHLITVEGLAVKDKLHPVQEALLDAHGTQCGFCTPGFVMSILGLFLLKSNPDKEDVLSALEGNLCRCTGYDSILKAVNLVKKSLKNTTDLLPAQLKKVEALLLDSPTPICFTEADNPEGWETKDCYIPRTLSELWDNVQTCKQKGNFKFLAGGTDLIVLANIQHIHSSHIFDLSNLKELQGIYLSNERSHSQTNSFNKFLVIGGNVTMTELLNDKLVKRHFPVLIQALKQMASMQIRNSATMAGNIANASPVADGATTLMALEAEVIIISHTYERRVKLSDFYHGYKQTELKSDEIIRAITIPLPRADKVFTNFIKSAKRKAVDISGVVSAIKIGYNKDTIIRAVISYGGVAPYPALAHKTMTFLRDKKIDAKWIEYAGETAMSEFTPISDVRGQEAYRNLLIKNHIIKHLQMFLEYVDSI